MSNHHHVVLHIDKNQAKSWKTREILHRWTQLFAGPYLVQRYLAGDLLDKAELVCVCRRACGLTGLFKKERAATYLMILHLFCNALVLTLTSGWQL